MMDTDPDILVRRFVDDDLSPDEVREALHRIADDAEARDLLQFEVQMTQDLASTGSAQPPSDFAEATMASLPAESAPAPAPEPTPSGADPLQQWWRALLQPVALEVRPLSATAVALVLGVALVSLLLVDTPTSSGPTSTASTASSNASPSVQATTASSEPQRKTTWIRFTYTNNEADSVAVAGDFSQWQPVSLSPRTVNGETVWTGLVPVSRGEHEYQFVINGERWVADPLAPTKRSDGFGAKNAVLEI